MTNEESHPEESLPAKDVLEAMPDGVVVTDMEFQILQINQEVLEMFGYSRSEVIGRPFYSFLVEEDIPKLVSSLPKTISRGAIKDVEYRGVTKEGIEFPISVNGALLRDEKGNPTNFIIVFRDITDRKKAEEKARMEKERYEELFEGANEMVITTDPEGYVKRLNKQVEEVSGYSKDELKGESILKIAHPEDEDKYTDFWEQIREGKEPVLQLRALVKGDNTIYLRAGGRPLIEGGEIVEIQYNAQDITELVETREKLEIKNKELEDKNAELETFVYTVSHDLRTPLISLEGFSDILEEEFSEKLGSDGEHYLDRIRANVEKMNDFIEDLLQLSRIGRKESPKQNVDLESVIREVTEDLSVKVEEGGVDIEIDGELPEFYFEEKRLYQIFSNLISNGIKYMGDQEDPRIRIGCEDKDSRWLLWVEDNGIGIEPENHDDIFEVFTREERVGEEGTGVGLSIVKRIVESHNGRIWVESEKGEGSTFYVQFPKGEVRE